MTVEQDTKLRKTLRDNNVSYKVYKNTLVKFAVAGTEFEQLAKHLEGPTAVAVSKDDATAPAKFLVEFAKTAPALELKGGIVGFSGRGTYDHVLGFDMKPKSTEQLAAFIQAAAPLPFIVKGVLSVADAVKVQKAGAAGIVLSHHHNMMEYSVPPLMVLPKIRAAVGADFPIIVDCGIVSGMDAYKALALGADGVSVGRELMKPLKNGGQAVADRIRDMTAELASVMARTGVKDLKSFDPTVLHFWNV